MIDEKVLLDALIPILNEHGDMYLAGRILGLIDSQPKAHKWVYCGDGDNLPKEPFGCLVTVIDTNPMTMEDFENILPYHVGYDGRQWNNEDGKQIPFDVIAWQPLPEPYREVE